jgi:hypothetical protein
MLPITYLKNKDQLLYNTTKSAETNRKIFSFGGPGGGRVGQGHNTPLIVDH